MVSLDLDIGMQQNANVCFPKEHSYHTTDGYVNISLIAYQLEMTYCIYNLYQ